MDDARTMAAIQVLADHVGDFDAQFGAIHSLGFDKAQTHRLIAFVPSGFAKPFIEKFGGRVSNRASVLLEGGGHLDFDFDKQPLYVAAERLGRAHMERGCLPTETFATIVVATAEVQTLNEALNKGASTDGCVLATCFTDHELATYVAV